MKQTNDELLRKFQTLKEWMIGDTERAMFQARANFLVAQGLLNYTEIAGSFIAPDGYPGERFDVFFGRMGQPYKDLLKRFNGRRKKHPHVVYDDLRCGLTHEYVIKRKRFTVFNPPNQMSDEAIDNITVNLSGTKVRIQCGVIHAKIGASTNAWFIVNPKYWLDFKNALEAYWNELQDRNNKDLRQNFFKRARQINLLGFGNV
jgi:hypothetical protein